MHIPERWKRRSARPDHSRFYMCIMWALFCSMATMFVAPKHVPMVVAVNPVIAHALAFVLCLGTGCCIAGFSLGSRFFFPKADLRNAFRLAIFATPANVSALAMWALTIGQACHWAPVTTFYSVASTMFILIAHVWMAWDLHWEIGRINERVKVAIQVVLGEVEDAGPRDN